jgi:hypothetical protein
MATPAWRAMSTGARCLYIELRGRLSNDYRNNGKVYLSDRDAAKALGVTPGSVVRWYAENEFFGFLRKTCGGFLGSDGRGIATHYRLTEHPTFDNKGAHIMPTRDFDRWDGRRFRYAAKPKKQNPVLKIDTPCIKDRHIRDAGHGECVCVEDRHIENGARCVQDRHISRIATPLVLPSQGSSTFRASAQAGDVGSTPTPVASLIDMVLVIVASELHKLELRA